MKIIAFKRSQNNPSLHPEFITEYIDADLLESTEGYETMIEEHFNLELAKNAERHQNHQKHLQDQEVRAHQAKLDSQIVEQKEMKELEREFNRFKAWQRHQGKK